MFFFYHLPDGGLADEDKKNEKTSSHIKTSCTSKDNLEKMTSLLKLDCATVFFLILALKKVNLLLAMNTFLTIFQPQNLEM